MSGSRPAAVQIDTRSLWRLRVSGSLTRWVLYATAAVGLIATVRYTVAPPRPLVAPPAPVITEDLGAEGFATLFARRYLTWDAASPTLHRRGLAPFVAGTLDPDLGLAEPARGAQRVVGAAVVQARAGGPQEHMYTVAVDTGGETPTYLSVDVVRDAAGELALGRYPALVGPPLTHAGGALDAGAGPGITDSAISTVVERAVRNYLAGSTQNLAADLAPGAVVATPAQQLTLDRIEQLRIASSGGVLATVGAHDGSGTAYTLTYELGLQRRGGRWLVGAIQTDPRT